MHEFAYEKCSGENFEKNRRKSISEHQLSQDLFWNWPYETFPNFMKVLPIAWSIRIYPTIISKNWFEKKIKKNNCSVKLGVFLNEF